MSRGKMRHGLRPADRTAATALFLGGGWVSRGPRGSVNSSEVCMLRERHSGSRRGRSRGTPPDPTERGHTGRTAVHPLFYRREAGNLWGKFVFLSQFSSVFCSSSSRLKSVLNTCAQGKEGGGPFDLPLRKCLKFLECHGRFGKLSSDSFVVMGYEVQSGGQTSPEVLKLRM